MQKITAHFKQAQDRYGIVGKELAAAVGISTNHLSEIRNGKVWPSEEVFARLLEEMERLGPGSREYFCRLMAGDRLQHWELRDRLHILIEAADDEELQQAFLLIGQKMFRKSTDVLGNKERLKSPIPL